MEIKRTTELLVEINRRFVIHQSNGMEQILCHICGAQMLTAEQIAEVFNVSRRTVYQFVETGAVHFAEVEPSAVVMICVQSFETASSNAAKQITGNTTTEKS